jgi:hypothetical protein
VTRLYVIRSAGQRHHRTVHSNFSRPMDRFHHAAAEFRIFKYAFTADLAAVDTGTILPATLLDVSPRVMASVGLSVVATALCYPFMD